MKVAEFSPFGDFFLESKLITTKYSPYQNSELKLVKRQMHAEGTSSVHSSNTRLNSCPNYNE